MVGNFLKIIEGGRQMNKQVVKISRIVCVASIVLSFVCFYNVTQAQSNDNIRLGALKHLLIAAGIDAEMIPLQRPDGFSRAIYVEGPQEIPIIIGFKQDNAAKENSILISVDGEEAIAKIAEDGSYAITPDQDFDLITALCYIEAVFGVFIDIGNCADDNICVATSIFAFIIDIIACSNLSAP
jgi:hypothetical protein